MSNINITTIQGKNLVIDISELVSKEVLYINATKLAKQFKKDVREWLKNKETKEYIKVLNEGNSHQLKSVFSKRGQYGGTYIHSDIVIFFLRWLDVEFAVKCDKFIKETIQQIHNDKLIANATVKANKANNEWLQARQGAKETRKSLSDAIKAFCEYAQANRAEPYKDGKCPYYIKLTNLVYKSLGIEKPKGAKSARDVFNGAIVEKIEYLEKKLINIIESHIRQGIEYHEAFKHIRVVINCEASLLDEVA